MTVQYILFIQLMLTPSELAAARRCPGCVVLTNDDAGSGGGCLQVTTGRGPGKLVRLV